MITNRKINPHEICMFANQYHSVVEIGSGEGRFIETILSPHKIGVEGCQQMIDLGISQGRYKTTTPMCFNLNEIEKHFQPESVDCIIGLDIIEHFSIDDAISLILKCEKIAEHALAFFIPVGNHPQFVDDRGLNNSLNIHLSTWYPQYMVELGYKVAYDDNFHNEIGKDKGAMLAFKVK